MIKQVGYDERKVIKINFIKFKVKWNIWNLWHGRLRKIAQSENQHKKIHYILYKLRRKNKWDVL